MKKYAITGRSVISVYGGSIEELWNNILNNKKNFKNLPFEDDTKLIGKIDDISVVLTLKEEKRKLDRLTLFTLECVKLALLDAKLDLDSVDKEKIGVIFTTYHGSVMTNYKELYNLIFKGPAYVTAFWFPATTFNFPAGAIARYFKLNNVVNTCVVGSPSVWYACHLLQQGLLDIIILIAADEFFDGFCYFFMQNNFSRSTKCIFALDGGIIYSEACCAIVIETKESAIKRRAKIYAEIEKVFEITNSFRNTVHQRFYNNFCCINNNEIFEILAEEMDRDKVLWLGAANGIVNSFYDEITFIKKVIRKKNTNVKVFYTNIKEYIGETFSPSSLINLVIGTEIFEKKIIFGLGKVNEQLKNYVRDTNIILLEENVNIGLDTIISSAFLPNGIININIIKKG